MTKKPLVLLACFLPAIALAQFQFSAGLGYSGSTLKKSEGPGLGPELAAQYFYSDGGAISLSAYNVLFEGLVGRTNDYRPQFSGK